MPTLVGTVVLLAVTALGGLAFAALVRARARIRVLLAGLLFGLTVWALLQYFGFPLIQPLVTEKGFPPHWYAISFGVYGLLLGALMAGAGEGDGGDGAPREAPAPPGPAPARQEGTLSERERMEEWRRRRAAGR